MDSQYTERITSREIYALYARAIAAFQLGGELLPLGLEKARKALRLLSTLPRLTPEQQRIQVELREYISQNDCPQTVSKTIME